jgi:hypothetical protein
VAVTLNHASVQASDPERAALGLATITGGSVAEFHPVPGAFVCFLNGADWDGGLIEFYPRTVALAHRDGAVFFRAQESQRGSGGTHFNLTVPRTREELEALCRERALPHSWRDWQGLLVVWLDDDLMIECVPAASATHVSQR